MSDQESSSISDISDPKINDNCRNRQSYSPGYPGLAVPEDRPDPLHPSRKSLQPRNNDQIPKLGYPGQEGQTGLSQESRLENNIPEARINLDGGKGQVLCQYCGGYVQGVYYRTPKKAAWASCVLLSVVFWPAMCCPFIIDSCYDKEAKCKACDEIRN